MTDVTNTDTREVSEIIDAVSEEYANCPVDVLTHYVDAANAETESDIHDLAITIDCYGDFAAELMEFDELDAELHLDILNEVESGETDFTVDGYDWRVIHTDEIDGVLRDELSSDEYVLGCFVSWALADATGIDASVFDAMKESEAFEAIGKLVLGMDGALDVLADCLVSNDGYGHHFAHYDHNEHEVGEFYLFRCN